MRKKAGNMIRMHEHKRIYASVLITAITAALISLYYIEGVLSIVLVTFFLLVSIALVIIRNFILNKYQERSILKEDGSGSNSAGFPRQASESVQEKSGDVPISVLGSDFRKSRLKEVEREVDDILDLVIQLIRQKIDAFTIAVFFPTENGGYYIRRYDSESEYINEDVVIYPGVGVIGSFLKEGRMQLNLKEIVTDSMTLYYYSRDAGIRSLMAAPVKAEGVERGSVIVDSTEKKHFSDTDYNYLYAAAQLCGKAVYYAYLHNEHKIEHLRLVAMSGIEKYFFQKQDIDAVLDKIAEIIPFVFSCERMTISLRLSEDNEKAVIKRAWGLNAESFEGLVFDLNISSLAHILYKKNIILSRNLSKKKYEIRYCEDEARDSSLSSILVYPLGVNECKGLIMIESRKKNAFFRKDIDLLARLSTSAGVAMEKIFVLRRTRELAFRDGLSGLFNHRQFQQILGDAIIRSNRYNDNMALAIGDIDHFKNINDTYGHRFGDKVLKIISGILQNGIRNGIDTAARYGGEEFAVILEKADENVAMEGIERIRKIINETTFRTPKGNIINLSMSFGIALFRKHATEQEDLIQKADKALYCAKESGRNRTELYYLKYNKKV